tara:strand:- start:61936 stop:62124 length:189 start_codon:yes stop_codon:yes gene_type:complete
MINNVNNLEKFVNKTNQQIDQLNQAIINFKKSQRLMTKKEPTNLEQVIASYDTAITTLKRCK